MTATATRPSPRVADVFERREPPKDTPPEPASQAPGGGAGDTLTLLALTLSVAIGFGRLFSGTAWVYPVIIATVVGHGLAWFLRRRGAPTALAAAVTLLGVVLATIWTLLPQTTLYGLPTIDTLSTAADSLTNARALFRQVAAPTPAVPGFLLAIMVALGITAFMADWAAFRVNATFEALIPSFTVFIFTAGVGSGRYRLWATALFLIAALGFLLAHSLSLQTRFGTWFGGRRSSGPGTVASAGAALGGIALVVGLIVGPALPGADSGGIVRYKGQGPAGPASRATVSPLVDIRGRLQEHGNIEVFTVKSPVRAYWRLTSLDTFDGTIWSSEDKYTKTRGRLARDVTPGPGVQTSEVEQEFEVLSLSSIWAPAAYQPSSLSGLDSPSYNADTGSIITKNSFSNGSKYRVTSVIPSFTDAQLRTAQVAVPDDIRATYLAQPQAAPRVRDLTSRLTAGLPNQYEKALALQNYFRTFTYDLQAISGHDSRALETFLFDTKRGYCEQFAGAYAVMARLAGLPARVAVGFTPGDLEADGLYHVRDENAHAWPEVYFENFGWVAFEPTPGRGAPYAEGYTGVPEQQDPAGASPTTVPTTTPTSIAQGPVEGAEETIPDLTSGRDETLSAEVGTDPVIIGFFVVLGLIALYLLVVPLLHYLRRYRRHAAATTPTAKVLAAWADVEDAFDQAGMARHDAETYAEYSVRAGRSAGLSTEVNTELRLLAREAAASVFAGDDRSPEVVDRSIAGARQVIAAVQDQLGPRERVAWWLDPRRFLPARRSRTGDGRRAEPALSAR
ncbi:MAG: FIG001454: Transglutaminase-like enzymes, putative cysteine proteases [uncultured Acidimicrobiales bacterium]|uniref:FIG001454: Transglutaminase-like enzymes, putative cysteine proteases n=1 Tax=uncultured Acidimicrobiales bacterium TaxID=310071 RepID=A0A6J4IK58_9ACTN|nr:MAG: FIG001454: Transglutaminase-like enzymes, putative cysteine proteases [uncultured Acidimicrobiales bacterium]